MRSVSKTASFFIYIPSNEDYASVFGKRSNLQGNSGLYINYCQIHAGQTEIMIYKAQYQEIELF